MLHLLIGIVALILLGLFWRLLLRVVGVLAVVGVVIAGCVGLAAVVANSVKAPPQQAGYVPSVAPVAPAAAEIPTATYARTYLDFVAAGHEPKEAKVYADFLARTGAIQQQEISQPRSKYYVPR